MRLLLQWKLHRHKPSLDIELGVEVHQPGFGLTVKHLSRRRVSEVEGNRLARICFPPERGLLGP